jgi:hypothetical protein
VNPQEPQLPLGEDEYIVYLKSELVDDGSGFADARERAEAQRAVIERRGVPVSVLFGNNYPPPNGEVNWANSYVLYFRPGRGLSIDEAKQACEIMVKTVGDETVVDIPCNDHYIFTLPTERSTTSTPTTPPSRL